MVDMYRYFGEMWCLNHQLTTTLTEAVVFSETSVHLSLTTNRHRPEDSPGGSNLKLSFIQCSEKLDTESAAKVGHYEPIHSNIRKVLELLGCAGGLRGVTYVSGVIDDVTQ